MRCLFLLFWLPSLLASSITPPQSTVYRTFWHPMLKAERLDYCHENRTQCGVSVANCYCKSMGYNEASSFRKAPNLGLTRLISGENECRGWKCSGFEFIKCKGKRTYSSRPQSDYKQEIFVRPRWRNYPLAWCYANHGLCGKRAAYAFCRWQGYGKVIKYSTAKCVHASKEIGTSALCFNNECKSYEYIVCGR